MSMDPGAAFTPGSLFAGKYRIEHVLGEGGMGVVVAAHHVHLDERVAIKFLRKEIAGDGQAAARFIREARAASKAKNEHIARTYDVGVHDGVYYMVMEYLEGDTLAALVQQKGAAPPAFAVGWILQACDALASAHAAGIVHRDLKPENLFLARQPDGRRSIKVLDFGISKIDDGSGHRITTASALMGSPLYMSPEQMLDPLAVDRRADIWGLGVILHELSTGRHPFTAESLPQLCIKIREQPAPPLRSIDPALPASLERVVQRCLEKDPARRFQTVDELAAALREVDAAAEVAMTGSSPSLPASSGAYPPFPGANLSSSAFERPALERPASPARTTAIVVGLVGLALVGAVLGGAALVSRRHTADAPAAALVASSPAPEVTVSAPTTASVATVVAVESAAPAIPAISASAPARPAARPRAAPTKKPAPRASAVVIPDDR